MWLCLFPRGLYRLTKMKLFIRRCRKTNSTVGHVFQRLVQKHPDKVCLMQEDGKWTFQDVRTYPKFAYTRREVGGGGGRMCSLRMHLQRWPPPTWGWEARNFFQHLKKSGKFWRAHGTIFISADFFTFPPRFYYTVFLFFIYHSFRRFFFPISLYWLYNVRNMKLFDWRNKQPAKGKQNSRSEGWLRKT